MPSWYGFWAPAGTPKAIVDRLHQEIKVAMQAPAVTDKLGAMFFQPVVSSPAEFGAFIKREAAMVKELATTARIKVEA
jgi:tripartite-type tricarboxylate transporter receptor subunit TctC